MADFTLIIIQFTRADHSLGGFVVLQRRAELAQGYLLRPLHVGL